MLTAQKKGLKITDENFVSQMWFKYCPYWPMFLILLVCCVAGAWLFLHYTTPIYESTASILIKDKQKGLDDSKMLESLNQFSTKKIIENEIEILKSRSIMSQVVKKLHLYAPVYEHNGVKLVSAYSSSSIKIEIQNPDSLTEVKKVSFCYDKNTAKVVINNKSYLLNTWVKTEYGTLKFIPRNTGSSAANCMFFSLVTPRQATQSLSMILEVAPVGKLSTVVGLKLKDEDPQRSKDILNELIVAYNKAAINDRNELAANTLSFVEERLNFIALGLDSIEGKLQNYKTEGGAIDISSQGRLYLENVSSNDRQLGTLNMQLAVLNNVEEYLKGKDNNGGIVPSTVGMADPLLTRLLDKLYELELQYERMKKTTAQNNALLLSLSDQIEKIKPSILENIESQRNSLVASKNNLTATNGVYSSILQAIPKKERRLLEISREQNIKSSIYTFLLQKREETALAYSSAIADSRIVDAAESSIKPVSPNVKLLYILAVAMAFVIGIIIITGNETFQRNIISRQEIESLTTVPIIGEISNDKSGESVVIGESKRTLAAEQFRKLRTSRYFLGNPKKKKILITSTLPGEGKTFIMVNLGLSLALTGKKVVLLEFDLSNPSLNKKINLTPGFGITEYLNGGVEPEEIIKRTDFNENLFIIQAGTVSDNGSELITSERVKDLLQYLNNIFDYIIIDTPPVGLLSDAYVLSSYCDAILYVVRHSYTPKVLVRNIDENNRTNELKNMSIVFNGVKTGWLSKDNYGYSDAYKYIHKDKKQVKKGRLV